MVHSTSAATVLQLMMIPVLWNEVVGIDCYECYSFNESDKHCGDPFHPAYGKLTRDCTQTKEERIGEFPAKYCIKLIGNTAKDNVAMVFRGCSLESLDSQCSDFQFEKVRYYGCVMSCQEDGCNEGVTTRLSGVLVFVTVSAAMTFIINIFV